MSGAMFQGNGFGGRARLGRRALCATLSFVVLHASLAPVYAMPGSSQGHEGVIRGERIHKAGGISTKGSQKAVRAIPQAVFEEAGESSASVTRAAAPMGYGMWALKGLESAADLAFAGSKSLVNLIAKGVAYVLKNPGEALVVGLAAQVATIHAIRPVTNDFRINQNTTGVQEAPSAATLSNGNVFVAWVGDQTGIRNIYGRVLAPDGTALATDIAISKSTTGDQYNPSVAGLGNGNAFLVWDNDPNGLADIWGRVVSLNGTVISNELTINQNAAMTQYHSSVAALSNGNALVAWEGSQTGNWDIYGRVFFSNGTALGGEFTINQVTTGDQYNPSVAALSNGNALVAWYGNRAGTYDIYGRVLAPNGMALGGEFTINQVTTGDQYNPFVAGLSNGNALVAWYDYQTGIRNIYGRVLAPNGTALTNDFLINQNMTDQAEFSAIGLSNGNAFVVWWSSQAGTYDVYGRVVSPDGSVINNEFLVNQNTVGSQYYPSVAALNNSSALVAWQGSAWEIYGRVFDLSDPTTVTTGTVITGSQTTDLNAITGLQTTSSVFVPTLLGVGGAVLGVSLGGTLLTTCVVGGICGIKQYQRKQPQKQVESQRLAASNPYGTPPELLPSGKDFLGKGNPYGTPPELLPSGKDFLGKGNPYGTPPELLPSGKDFPGDVAAKTL